MHEKNRSEKSTIPFITFLSNLNWKILSFPIFLKIMGTGFLVTILFGSVTLIQTRSGTLRILSQILEQKALGTTEMLADSIEESASNGDTPSILNHLDQAREIYPEIFYALVRDPDGRVMASTFRKGIPSDILDASASGCPPDCGIRIYKNSEGTIYEASAAISAGDIGTVQVGFTDDNVSQRRIIRRSILKLASTR